VTPPGGSPDEGASVARSIGAAAGGPAPEGAAIEFRRVVRAYPGGPRILDGLDLDVRRGETLILIGPSGCGKTTALKLINRLAEADSGEVRVDGRDVKAWDPFVLRRRIGYVIQETGLFPHMDIARNVEVVPRLLGWDEKRRGERTDEMLRLVGLDPAAHRHKLPHELSGGQRQRAGVARALAADPPVVLMDEPFGALDPITRARLQEDFGSLARSLAKTIVFVTHDIVEAFRLGTRIALMRSGRVHQIGRPADFQERPADDFVRDFVASGSHAAR
jgi:osmoprotectant transport system ATP-binding protein